MPLTAATGGGSWQDDNNDDAGIGIGVGIGAGPNSGGNNGDCVLPLHPRGGGLRGLAACHNNEPRVAPRQAAARVGRAVGGGRQ